MTNILKFFFGIVLAQVATYALFVLSPTDSLSSVSGMLRFVVPLLFIALALAFWFASIASHHSKNSFVKERETLRKETQRDKERIIKEAQRNITVESTKTHAKANFKVGAAFAGALGVGALFVFAQMVTAGLLALAATGGAMGGYYIRSKKAQKENLLSIDAPRDALEDVEVIEHKS
ncbi:MAG: Unknown protein [uncultured Sulfurovum sp.]|uniref:Uncharacterized protein n=1 Tax=uncultured Sulfurovum sp. TaxID=269237 RepID=A0A6S6UGY7_9BACT|nr:MAG: Unknown protein [uncultured Sulfurovum sp.]